MSVVKLIKNFKKTKRTLFTTPSHSQGAIIADQSADLLGKKVFACDYSEIEGFDNLADPIGAISLAQDKASKFYGSKATFFLINGSTSGMVAAMYTMLTRHEKVLIARNCHKSVYNGLVLTGAVPVWILPDYNEEWGIYEGINPEVLDLTLSKNKDIKLFIMTNPTYEGYIADITQISEICKKHDVKLLVDEAHGALFSFNSNIGTSALNLGADIVIQSLHKTAGALNPSALLHIGENSTINPKDIQKSLNLFTTTSPSYPLLANIEGTINFLSSKKGKKEIDSLLKNINELFNNLKTIPNLKIYSNNNDITKILIQVYNVSGFELSDILMYKYHVEDELANEKSVLLLTGIGTTKTKLKKLEKTLIALCSDNLKIISENKPVETFTAVEPRVRYTPAFVWGKEFEEIDIKFSLSRVCMEVIADYPPGIPVLLPGEVIRKEHIKFLSGRKTIKVLV